MNNFEVYTRLDISFKRAEKEFLYDNQGKQYIDFYGGHAVISIGHTHPHYVSKITEQLQQIGFFSNAVQIPQQATLANQLAKISGYTNYQLFLCNSGAEANENALKLASFHTQKAKVIAFKNAFHGRTSGAVAITDNPKIIAPYNQGHQVVFLEYDLDAIEKQLKSNTIAAIIFEPIQGVGGIIMPQDTFVQHLQRLANQYQTPLIADEIQSGYARTGAFFAHQHSNIKPDIITIAKGMGNGFPIGGVLISPNIKPIAGMLGTTFGGNQLACAAATAVLDVIEDENLIQQAKDKGNSLMQFLQSKSQAKDVRGRGLMIGIEYHQKMKEIKNHLLHQYGILTGSSGTNTLRLLPPLTISNQSIKQLKNAIIQTEKKFL